MFVNEKYVGVFKDNFGGMTNLGRVVRDAWVFGILDESESCEGWSRGQMDDLYQKVTDEWDKHGCLVSKLPPELFERHQEIYSRAVTDAKDKGWSGDIETLDDK